MLLCNLMRYGVKNGRFGKKAIQEYIKGDYGGTDKSPLGQKPTRTKAHRTISHRTKAHCLIWQGGQKPTSLKK